VAVDPKGLGEKRGKFHTTVDGHLREPCDFAVDPRVRADLFIRPLGLSDASSDARFSAGVAERIAAGLRESSGGLAGIQAKGFVLAENIVQVSMNVTDLRAVALYRITGLVRREAAAAGVAISACELVGLTPLAAIADSAAYYLHLSSIDGNQISW